MNAVQTKCKELLQEHGVDIDSEIDFDINGSIHTLSFLYIIETFMQASEESQLVFYAALHKATQAKQMGIEKFFEGMGELLLRTHISKNMKF